MTTSPIETGPPMGRLGPYRLVEKLGEGGMGVVYCGLDERGRGFAVKVLREHIAHDPQARARLEREVNALKRVDHPRVAPFIGADVQGPRPYLVTRLVPGPPLDVWIERHGPLRGPALRGAAVDLLQALNAIHAVGVVHRDLKPGNVLMPEGRPVVIDFGIAHAGDEVRLTSTGFVMGTPGYIAPELLDGGSATTATDWWGFGATLAFMATGRAPFGRGPTEAVLDRVRRGQVDLGGVDTDMAELLLQALDPTPGARPTAAQIEAALSRLAATAAAAETSASGATATAGATTQVVPQRPSGVLAAVTARIPVVRRSQRPGTQVPPPSKNGTGGQPSTVSDPGPATMVHPLIATRSMPVAAPAPTQSAPRYAGFTAPRAPESGYSSAAGGYPPANVYPGSAPGAPAHPGSPQGPLPYAAAAPSPPPAVAPPAYPPARSGTLAAIGLLFVVGAAIAPALVAVLALTWSVAARFTKRCSDSLWTRRMERGPRRRDVASVAALSPFFVLGAVFHAAFAALLPSLVAVSAYYGVATVLAGAAGGSVRHAGAFLAAAAAALVVAWWGPGGGALRRGSRSMARALTPGRYGVAVIVGLALLGAAVMGLITQSSGYLPTLWPVSEGYSWGELLPSVDFRF
ncbi:serine/threonine-protein kinase [Gephyromycinifex aptenodytis]|uniref:serine/threonine-protein kinase n=1 Tax=Gephyromycinifex aptenodytis TaxID=2716227 RepID=UPI0014464C34|nr:serine/threonine-protein kinase [Gephyromycinifex aptenodytis]